MDEMTNKAYHAHDAISSSDVKAVYSKSVLHWVKSERKETAAMALGTAVHGLVLEPERELVIRGPETRRGNAWKDAVSAAELHSEDAVVLPEAEFDRAYEIAQSARQHKLFKQYIESGDTKIEQSYIVTDKEYGVQIKTRPDIYSPANAAIIDLKTCQDASARGFGRQAFDLGYHIQAYHYMRVLRLLGMSANKFAFLAVETAPPYACCFHIVDQSVIEAGERDWREAMERIAAFKERGGVLAEDDWQSINVMTLPAWKQL